MNTEQTSKNIFTYMKKRLHKKMFNNKGPRIDPCGTPNTVSSQELNDIFIFVLCRLCVK